MTLRQLVEKRKLVEEEIIRILEEYEKKVGSEVLAVGFTRDKEGKIKILINNGYY